MKKKEIYQLVIAVGVCQATGLIGSIFTRSSVSKWYPTLLKPSFTPPGWVFGPVWVGLYFLMGVAAFLVWRRGLEIREVRKALFFFAVQLGLNLLWSVFFFGLKSPVAGLADIVLLSLAIIFTIRSFLPVSKPAALLLVPYFLWTSFATGLNLTIWYLNR
jgi:tryptophan-rich sensory protein